MLSFSERVLQWYDRHGRHQLPWSLPRTAYRVWVSEIMLQQTQVATVIPYFERFMQRFPTIDVLANSPLDDVLSHWSGLGYYARARNLHRAAQQIVNDHHGEFPRSLAAVMALPGIGRSTAGAILALAFDQRESILDGNVKRVLARYYAIEGWPDSPSVAQKMWQLTTEITPTVRAADYTQAIMDLGATVCTRSRPRCDLCPLNDTCRAHELNRVADFPSARPRRVLPRKSTHFLVLEDRSGAWLLERRPPHGIWGGLWSFPEVVDSAAGDAWCEAHGFRRTCEFNFMETIEHTFTHFHLSITPLHARVHERAPRCMDSNRWLWYNNNQPPQVGFAKPVTHLLANLAQTSKEINA